MIIKLLASAPLAALMGYISASFNRLDGGALERGLIDFMVLGVIPGTQTQINFEVLAFIVLVMVWLPVVMAAYRWTQDMIERKLNLATYFDSIAL